MDINASSNVSIDWDTDDDLDFKDSSLTSLNVAISNGESSRDFGEASSTSGSKSKVIQHFLGMCFSEKLIIKAIEENGEENTESILETLLTYSALEDNPQQNEEETFQQNGEETFQQNHNHDYDNLSSDYEAGFLQEDFFETDCNPQDLENLMPVSEEDKKVVSLIEMGYMVEEAEIAMKRCGPDSSLLELTDFITAAQMSREADALLPDEPRTSHHSFSNHKRRKNFNYEVWKQKRHRGQSNGLRGEEDSLICLPNPMIGFGTPHESFLVHCRTIPDGAMGPPYFYYENVALAPKGVWASISRFLYELEPEFVDSKYFCAAARKRGYVHNLPIENRFPLLPLPPRTIHDALPLTKRWWPKWDKRTKLNCLQTCIGSAKLTERIRKSLEDWADEPPESVQKYVIEECRKWNLVWVGKNKVAPLEPDEFEMLLGFPKNHTRGGGISRTDRYKSLGNSFQVDTVAYHLSVLKNLFPGGMNVLSLFSGIGGSEVALHRLGISLKTVVSVEISETNRNIVRGWWEQTNQKGTLIDMSDVQALTSERLEQLINTFGGFDLVIGGSPCNNLAGSNRVSRDGLEGKESSLFYDYFRILDSVKCLMLRNY